MKFKRKATGWVAGRSCNTSDERDPVDAAREMRKESSDPEYFRKNFANALIVEFGEEVSTTLDMIAMFYPEAYHEFFKDQ